jgi:hypothetical protein
MATATGDSLPNMPIDFGGKYTGKREELGQACQAACERYQECVAYTLLPARGVCYLKTVASPVRALGACLPPACDER